jgi:hypothetical protein
MENKVRLTYLKIAGVVVCVFGSALVAFSAAALPNATGFFALVSVLPVLIPLPSLILSNKNGQAWVCVLLSAAAVVGSFYQYNNLGTAPDPFALFAIWAYPLINTGVVFLLLLLGMVLSIYFQFRRGEV